MGRKNKGVAPAGKKPKKSGAGVCKANKDGDVVSRLQDQQSRLNLKRLERLVAREAQELTNWVAPPPPAAPRTVLKVDEEGIVFFKRKARSGPDDWKLRGAARPWESLNDGTLDPNGREYDPVVEGTDLFADPSCKGKFWTCTTRSSPPSAAALSLPPDEPYTGGDGGAARAHVLHLRELSRELAVHGRLVDALNVGCSALELDTSDGGGVCGGGHSPALARLLLGFAPRSEEIDPSARKKTGPAAAAAAQAQAQAQAFLNPHKYHPKAKARAAPDGGGGSGSPAAKKTRPSSSSSLSSSATGGAARGAAKGGATGAVASRGAPKLPAAVWRRALRALRAAAAESMDAACAALLVALVAPSPSLPCRSSSSGGGGVRFAAALAENNVDTAPSSVAPTSSYLCSSPPATVADARAKAKAAVALKAAAAKAAKAAEAEAKAGAKAAKAAADEEKEDDEKEEEEEEEGGAMCGSEAAGAGAAADLAALSVRNKYVVVVLAFPHLFAEAARAADEVGGLTAAAAPAVAAAAAAREPQEGGGKALFKATPTGVGGWVVTGVAAGGGEEEKAAAAEGGAEAGFPAGGAARASEWGRVLEALRYWRRDGALWRWAGAGVQGGDGEGAPTHEEARTPTAALRGLLGTVASYRALGFESGLAPPGTGAPDAHFPAVRRFEVAWNAAKSMTIAESEH